MTKTKEQVMRERDDRTMILTPSYWSGYVLPLKQRQAGHQPARVGYIMEPSFGKPQFRLYHGNIWSVADDATFTDYESVEALLADGWVVD